MKKNWLSLCPVNDLGDPFPIKNVFLIVLWKKLLKELNLGKIDKKNLKD